jgi:uncharacterized membrane protein HdeD (DUF308 family)/acetyl esterase/lipase
LLLTRPLTSLTTLVVLVGLSLIVAGVADLVQGIRDDEPAATRVVPVAWVAAGIAVLALPDPSVRLVSIVVGLALIGSGLTRLVGAVRGTIDQRLARGLLGLAAVLLGLLALVWPDVTVLVVAVVFGARVLLFGLWQMWVAMRGPRASEDPAASAPGGVARFFSVAGAVLALVIVGALAGLSAALRDAAPTVDDFYSAPAEVPGEPGALVRAEPFDVNVPDDASAWRILYTTTRDEGVPALASAIVMTRTAGIADARPVLAWAHGTTGFAEPCAPSNLPKTLDTGALPALPQILDNEWTLVATDYVGLGTQGPHPYLIGQGEGRSVLDAVRAARQLDEVQLTDETVVWGHSQGGHAALWTGVLAEEYAPDVPLSGVAALAPASDLLGLVRALPDVTGGSVFASYVIQAYTDIYDDVRYEDIVRPAAQPIVREMAQRCLSGPGVLVSVLEALALESDVDIFEGDPTQGAFGQRLAENVPTGRISAPLLVGQGLADPLVRPDVQEAYVQERCADGQPIDFRTYPGRDHVGVVAPDSELIPELLAWTQERLAGESATPTCGA